MDWITKAIGCYEKAEALAPDDLRYRWRLVDLYLNDSRADKMLAELDFLSRHSPNDKDIRAWYESYRKAYNFGD